MKCMYCNTETDLSTSTGSPICHSCANEHNFPLCTESGCYIEDDSFQCDNNCNDCICNDR